MLRKSLFILSLLVCATSVHAKSSANIQRGGLGFLFPDHNSFSNPGQFATAHGSALEFGVGAQSEGGTKSFSPSFVYGNGSLGFGLSAIRAGTSLTSSGNYADVVSGGMGFSLLKERMTIGAKYSRMVTPSSPNDGELGLTLTLQGARRMGASFGLGYNRGLGGGASSAVVGFGYGFQSSNSLEANVTFNNLDNTSDFTASGFFNLGKQWFYMGAGYSYANLLNVHSGQARVGAMVGTIDFSALISAPLTSGGTLSYGGTLRAAF